MLRTIKAKFPTHCASCGASIDRGDRVRWNGNGKVYCIDHKAHAPTSSSYPVQVILIGADGAVNVHRTDWEVFSKIAAILDGDTLVSTAPAFHINVESLPVESIDIPAIPENKPENGKTYRLTGGTGDNAISNGNTWADSEVKPEPVSDPMAAMFAKLQAIDA